jgi:beta-galactosidase
MNAPRLGVAYYPEQWPRERWEIDAANMVEAGIVVARIGEFAWSRVEPSAGAFELDWLDEAVGVLASAGLEVILGTPTAAPPAWLVEQHPEILPVRADGRVHGFGHRRHYCPNQPAMRDAAARIVRALAERFGTDERVVAWQIDNELGGRCYCDTCREAFQSWLAARYDSLTVLNEVWGTAFWSQEYTSWTQIPLPDGASPPPPGAFGFGRNAPNPGLALDFRRFTSDSLIDFLRLQVAILRAACESQPITHNLMGFRFSEIDYYALAAEIDNVSWDNYPVLDISGRRTNPALSADAMRGLKHAPVWVLEQQAGPLGWELVRSPRREELRTLTWQAIAHGAELVGYFRWRTARFGTEQHWHGIVEANGTLGHRFDDVRALAAEIADVGGRLDGARSRSAVAILSDYESRFALQVQPTNPSLGYEETVHAHYAALRAFGLGVDVVAPDADLSAYRLVVAPALYVMDESRAAALAAYVESGGMLVLAPRTAVKDRCNAVPERPVPAWLDELAGLEVSDFMSLEPEHTVQVEGGSFHGWYEELTLRGASTLAAYADGPFAGGAAVAEHATGDGTTVYIGGVADATTLHGLYRALAERAGLTVLDLPPLVEVVPLANDHEELVVVLNHSDEKRSIELAPGRWQAYLGDGGEGTITLPPFGVAVLGQETMPSRPAAAVADADR